MFKRLIASLVCFSFVFSNLQYVHAQDFSINQLPVPGTMVGESAAFVPVMLKGMVIYPDNPLRFDFIVDSGNTKFTLDQVKQESNRLVKYFLAAMTVPQNDLWVNLSPYESNRIISNELGLTGLGRDMLAQDYILKQITSSLIYPEKGLGKDFWDKIYKEAYQRFGTTQVPVNTFNKVWIMPDEAMVYENGNAVYVVKSRLKVMLDEDYLSLNKHVILNSDSQIKDVNSLGSQIVRQIILPEIEKEVNTGKNFAAIRQIYQSLILAKWYKETIKESLLSKVYIDQKKIKGVDLSDPTVKDQIYDRYLKAFKKGVFNLIKEDYDSTSHQTVPRKYFSGGEIFGRIPVKQTKNRSLVDSSVVGDDYKLSLRIDPFKENGDTAMLSDEFSSLLAVDGPSEITGMSFKVDERKEIDNIKEALIEAGIQGSTRHIIDILQSIPTSISPDIQELIDSVEKDGVFDYKNKAYQAIVSIVRGWDKRHWHAHIGDSTHPGFCWNEMVLYNPELFKKFKGIISKRIQDPAKQNEVINRLEKLMVEKKLWHQLNLADKEYIFSLFKDERETKGLEGSIGSYDLDSWTRRIAHVALEQFSDGITDLKLLITLTGKNYADTKGMLDATIKGFELAEKLAGDKYGKKFAARLVVAFARHDLENSVENVHSFMKTVIQLRDNDERFKKYIVGLDFAGAEAIIDNEVNTYYRRTSDYIEVIKMAKAAGLEVTAHLGDMGHTYRASSEKLGSRSKTQNLSQEIAYVNDIEKRVKYHLQFVMDGIDAGIDAVQHGAILAPSGAIITKDPIIKDQTKGFVPAAGREIKDNENLQAIEGMLERIKQEGLEIRTAPTANTNTQKIRFFKGHPFHQWLKRGIKVSINADDFYFKGTVPVRTLSDDITKMMLAAPRDSKPGDRILTPYLAREISRSNIEIKTEYKGKKNLVAIARVRPDKEFVMRDYLSSNGFMPENGIYIGNESTPEGVDYPVLKVGGISVFAVDKLINKVDHPKAVKVGEELEGTEKILKRLIELLGGSPFDENNFIDKGLEKVLKTDAPRFLALDVDGTVAVKDKGEIKPEILMALKDLIKIYGFNIAFVTKSGSSNIYRRIAKHLRDLIPPEDDGKITFYTSGMMKKSRMSRIGEDLDLILVSERQGEYNRSTEIPYSLLVALRANFPNNNFEPAIDEGIDQKQPLFEIKMAVTSQQEANQVQEFLKKWIPPDMAMNGGIDMKGIHVDREGDDMNVKFDPAAFQDILNNGVDGFVPVIVNITPIQNPLQLLGVNPAKEPEVLAKA